MALKPQNVVVTSSIVFIAWGLAVQQLPFLRYLGHAFVFGVIVSILLFVVLTLSIQSRRQSHRWRDTGFKSPALVRPEAWVQNNQWLGEQRLYKAEPLYPRSFVVSEAFDNLINQLLRDLVISWYTSINRDSRFVNEIDRHIRIALHGICTRLLQKDTVEIVVLQIVPLITKHFKEFFEAEKAVRGPNLDRNVTESEELDIAIARKYQDGRLHPAVSLVYSDPKPVQQEHLRKIVARLLPELLPVSFLKSGSVAILIKEVVTCSVLAPTLQMLCDPDTWNRTLEAYASLVLQDRKTVRKLRAALDQHTLPVSTPSKHRMFPRLSSGNEERQFERFVRAVRQLNNLSDARRFRSEVASQLQKESVVEEQDPVFLRRLETGKYLLDQKIQKLAATPATRTGLNDSPPLDVRDSFTQLKKTSVIEVLHDSAGLSYFMEYMDRQQQMSLVQFWIVVEGFRDPLKDGIDPNIQKPDAVPHWKDTDRSDLAQIYETYLTKPEFKVSSRTQEVIEDFLKNDNAASDVQYSHARQAIMQIHSAVFEELQEVHFPRFKSSDLYYKYVSSENPTLTKAKGLAKAPRPPLIPAISEDHSMKSSFSPGTSAVVAAKQANIRRNATSSSDLRSAAVLTDFAAQKSRRSLDEINTSGPLFDDDGLEADPLAKSTRSLGQDSLNNENDESSREHMVDVMENALNDIMAENNATSDSKSSALEASDALFPSLKDEASPRSSGEIVRVESGFSDKSREKPNLASLGLVNTAGRIGVFTDNDLFGDEEKFPEDEHADEEKHADEKAPEDEVQEAMPGDLGLAEAISALNTDIERLIAQESVVDTLTRKAELTNNVAELRILGKSKSSLQREIRRKELQRQQYIVQEGDNSLYGRATVEIKSIMVGREEDGQEFALYIVEVQRKANEQTPAASWAVARRYSEFHDLHHRLRRFSPAIRHLEFPRRRLVMKLQRDFLEKRRVLLQGYLRELLRMPAVCRSRDLRAFLSQRAITSTADVATDGAQRDIVSRIYSSVADGMDEFLGNIPVLDQLSVAGQNLISAATSQLSTNSSVTSSTSLKATVVEDESSLLATSAEARAELLAFDPSTSANTATIASADIVTPFVKPISDLFLETFSLNRGNSWLRGRAVVVVLHQLLGGTIERKTRDTARSLVTEENLLRYINLVKEALYPPSPDGSPSQTLRREWPQRTPEQKTKSKREAGVLLATLIPDLAGSVVGKSNAQEAGRKMFAALNNERLLGHIVFEILDKVIDSMFLSPGSEEAERLKRTAR